MSDTVGSVIFGPDVVENVEVAVGIASLTLSVQLLFPLPVFTLPVPCLTFLVSDVGRCRAVSAVPYLCRTRSKMWG